MPSSASEAVADDSIHSGSDQVKTDHTTSEPSEVSAPRRRLTFISHAGENKSFVRKLLVAIEQQSEIAAFFDDDMPVGTSSENEMVMRAGDADQGIVVISRPFVTKEWPMKELNLFLQHGVKIFPLYYDLSPEDLWDIIATYDGQAGDDEPAFREKMRTNPIAWRTLMEEISSSSRFEESSSLPDPCTWRDDVGRLASLTGLRREDFGNDESGYIKACANMVSPPGLPDTVPPLPDHYVKSAFINGVMSTVLDHAPNSEPCRLVLTGMGGAGKTVAVSAVVRNDRVRRHFKDGILWMTDETGDFSEQRFVVNLNKLEEQFRQLVLSRHYRQGNAVQYEKANFQAIKDVHQYFSIWQKKFDLRCLLVVDNAWNMEGLESLSTMGFDIIVTTREKDIVPMGPGWRFLEIPPMNDNDSLLLLKSCSGADETMPRELALQVTKDCAFLPLALAIAGSTMYLEDASSEHSWRKLHEKLEKKAKIQTNKVDKKRPLNAVLAVSFNAMGRRQRGHFLELAVLTYDVIAPNEMLCHLWEEQDLADAKFIARDLVDRCLMHVRGDTYTVHDIVLDFAKSKIADFESIRESAVSRHAQYLGRLDVTRMFAEGEVGAGYYWLIALWHSLEELNGDFGLQEKTYEKSLRPLKDRNASSDVAQAYYDVARLLEIQGKYGDAAPLYQRALEVNEVVHGASHRDVVRDLKGLAKVLKDQGKFSEAGPLYARATNIMEDVLGPEDVEVATMLTNHALCSMMQAQHSEAIPLLEKAFAIRRTKLGDDDKETMITKRSLRDARAAQVGSPG